MSYLLRRVFTRVAREQSIYNFNTSKVGVTPLCNLHQPTDKPPLLIISRKMNQTAAEPMTGDTITGHAKQIFKDAVDAVLPKQMMGRKLKYTRGTNTLYVDGKEHKLNNNLYVVGFGKAVSGMARVVDDMLGDHIQKGIISIPFDTVGQMKEMNKHDMYLNPGSKIQVFEGARNNLPDDEAYNAARQIHKLVSTLVETDILIVLISGGGSALLPMPCNPITLEEELELTKLLAGRGATIQELNTVRSNIEVLKGGGLAEAAKPATVVSLILSDVIGDPLDFIASGPTYQSALHPNQCFHLFRSYHVMDQVPRSIRKCLEEKMKEPIKKVPESVDMPEFDSAQWLWVQNIIVGNNAIATAAAAATARDLGYVPLVMSTSLQGDTREVAEMFGKLANYILLTYRRNTKDYNAMLVTLEVELVRMGVTKNSLNKVVATVEKCKNMQKRICIITGGETTTLVKGSGLGGRNQEMVLAVSPHLLQIQGHSEYRSDTEICFLSAGSDGIDGPTDAAGAVVDIDFAASVAEEGRSVEQFMENNDSYNLFRLVKNGEHHIITGHTGTNVMDIQILIVKP